MENVFAYHFNPWRVIMKNDTKQFQIEVLTPVHIGSGMRKVKHIDFYSTKTGTAIVNIDQVAKDISDDPSLIRNMEYLSDSYSIGEFIQKYRRYLSESVEQHYTVRCESREILEYERNGMGIPYIPGSSLKGSIRTAILVNLFQNKNVHEQESLLRSVKNNRNPKWASQDILKSLLGQNPNNDIMRTIQVFDSHFAENDIGLLETKIFSLAKYGSWTWKKTEYGEMKVFGEILKPGSTSQVTLSLDQFLLKNPIAKRKLHFSGKIPDDFEKLSSLINEHTRGAVETEVEFYQKYEKGRDLDGLLREYEKVLKKIPDNGSGFVIRLGWGSGWKSMTGDYIPDDWLNQFKAQFRMGRRGVDVFPKSRKIGIQNNLPLYPLGWIKLTKESDH